MDFFKREFLPSSLDLHIDRDGCFALGVLDLENVLFRA
jgi:hypothetical protein